LLQGAPAQQTAPQPQITTPPAAETPPAADSELPPVQTPAQTPNE